MPEHPDNGKMKGHLLTLWPLELTTPTHPLLVL